MKEYIDSESMVNELRVYFSPFKAAHPRKFHNWFSTKQPDYFQYKDFSLFLIKHKSTALTRPTGTRTTSETTGLKTIEQI